LVDLPGLVAWLVAADPLVAAMQIDGGENVSLASVKVFIFMRDSAKGYLPLNRFPNVSFKDF
jgi:hypothetical protein